MPFLRARQKVRHESPSLNSTCASLSSLTADRSEQTVPCCDICDPLLFNRTRPGKKPRVQSAVPRLVQGQPDLHAKQALWRWRSELFARKHANAQFDPDALLPDDIILTLVSLSPALITSETLPNWLKTKWLFWDKYGDELVRYVRSLNIVYTPAANKVPTAAEILLMGSQRVNGPATNALPVSNTTSNATERASSTAYTRPVVLASEAATTSIPSTSAAALDDVERPHKIRRTEQQLVHPRSMVRVLSSTRKCTH